MSDPVIDGPPDCPAEANARLIARDEAYLGATLTGVLNSSLERDKSLLTLSAAGVGILSTFLTPLAAANVTSLILYVLALMGFIACIAAVPQAMQQNCVFLICSAGKK